MEDELVKEQPVYEIQKVKLKNNQVTADYTERFVEANYKNEVTKSSQQFVHPDLLYAMSLLKTHAVKICEMQEAGVVNIENPSDDDLNEKLKNIVVTGYSKGGSDESAGVSIQAQKLLKSGQVLNLSVPFTKFEDESGEGYPYGDALNRRSADLTTKWTLTCSAENMESNKNRSISMFPKKQILPEKQSRSRRNAAARKSRNGGCRRRDKSV